MTNLFSSNLTHHPGRTLATAAGVATGVILVVLTVGLVRGTLSDRGQRDAKDQEEAPRRLVERLPDSRVIFTRDLPVLFANGFAAFNVFLKAVVGLALAISLLIILLTTYTTVTERTRQIGILKALGASKRFIAMVFIKESMLVSAIEVAGGLLIALLARPAFAAWAGLNIEIEIGYTLCAALGGLAGGLMGAIYPALRAAGQDAVEALNYE
jgi:putative ABC transport system permease protein